MRFKTYLPNDSKHCDVVTCLAWGASAEEVFSAGDDHTILRWSLASTEPASKIADLPNDLYPTDFHLFPRIGHAPKKPQSASDLFVLTATDGKFYFINRHGRIERSVEAHKGAVLAGRWSYDGTALATVGEDGQVKIWSRSGMLRTNLSSYSVPVYSVGWSPNSDKVIYTLGRHLVIKALQPNSKPLQWKAHDALILCMDWNSGNNLIVSGAEDCKYKVWDSYGQIMYGSAPHDYPITSVAWAPDGELFAVGSFNTLRLCDKAGWSYCLEKPQTQSILCLAWSSEGTQVAGACGDGHIIFAHIVEKRLEWHSVEVALLGRKTFSVTDVSNHLHETLDCRDTIIHMALKFGYLLVITPSQCLIYKTDNWHAPQAIDLKGGQTNLVLQADKYFLIGESGLGLYVYTYEGKLVSNPKWPGMKTETLNRYTTSLSTDTLAVRDWADEKAVYIFDILSGKGVTDKPYFHKLEVLEIALDLHGPAPERKLALIDKNKDLYLINARATHHSPRKLGSMVQSMCWNDQANILAAIQERRLALWYHPAVVYVDKNLLPLTLVVKDSGDLGKNPSLVYFVNNRVGIRRVDGALITIMVSPYPSMLHSFMAGNQWLDALRLCRFAKDRALWACLAAAAISAKQLDTAEMSYAAIDESAKVLYIQYIKGLPTPETQMAEIWLLRGNFWEAEALLLQASLFFHAIMLNINKYHWKRALDLSLKHKVGLDVVVTLRNKYLQRMDIKENDPSFLEHAKEVLPDDESLQARMEKEYQKEIAPS